MPTPERPIPKSGGPKGEADTSWLEGVQLVLHSYNRDMATKFQMDPESTRSGLASADASASAQPTSQMGSLTLGAYTTPLVGAIVGTQAVRQANVEARVVANSVSREVSVAAVEVTEATNAGALTT
jgi:hypothetical protein